VAVTPNGRGGSVTLPVKVYTPVVAENVCLPKLTPAAGAFVASAPRPVPVSTLPYGSRAVTVTSKVPAVAAAAVAAWFAPATTAIEAVAVTPPGMYTWRPPFQRYGEAVDAAVGRREL
jgi:hypothetical protein